MIPWPSVSQFRPVGPVPSVQRPNASHDIATGDANWAFSASFLRPGLPLIQGAKALHPLPSLAGGVVILEPWRERPAGPKLTRAEQVES